MTVPLPRPLHEVRRPGQCNLMGMLLWLLSVVLVLVGIVQLFQGQILLGVIVLILGFGVGPGGFTFIKSKRA